MSAQTDAAASTSFVGVEQIIDMPAELYLLNQWRVSRGGAAMTVPQLAEASRSFIGFDRQRYLAAELYLLSIIT